MNNFPGVYATFIYKRKLIILGGVCRRSEVKFIVAVHCFLAKLKEAHVFRDFGWKGK